MVPRGHQQEAGRTVRFCQNSDDAMMRARAHKLHGLHGLLRLLPPGLFSCFLTRSWPMLGQGMRSKTTSTLASRGRWPTSSRTAACLLPALTISRWEGWASPNTATHRRFPASRTFRPRTSHATRRGTCKWTPRAFLALAAQLRAWLEEMSSRPASEPTTTARQKHVAAGTATRACETSRATFGRWASSSVKAVICAQSTFHRGSDVYKGSRHCTQAFTLPLASMRAMVRTALQKGSSSRMRTSSLMSGKRNI
eukprot:COSAG01_NODE_4647_length_4852_cov_3.841153_3_plen_253_part_00